MDYSPKVDRPTDDRRHSGVVTPNHFEGTDSERIQAAVDRAATTTGVVTIPAWNASGADRWLIDRAILLPGGITVVLDDCTIQLSDTSRDNFFRSANVGEGVTEVRWLRDIAILGRGRAVLRGAANPRSTASGKTLALDPAFDSPLGRGKMSYGTDAGKDGEKQTGDWRNHGILMAYVDGFLLSDVTIEQAHCWAVTHERVVNAELTRIRIDSPPEIVVDGVSRYVANRDGINLRHGCKHFRIDDISGETGDDFIALTSVGLNEEDRRPGRLQDAYMVTTLDYEPGVDDTEDIHISNIRCRTKNHGVAIRAGDIASIHHVYIDGLTVQGNPDFQSHQTAILFGGRGYGKPNVPGSMYEIHAMNLIGTGRSALVHVEEAIVDCTIVNGIYTGEGEYVVSYHDLSEHTPKYTTSEGNSGRELVHNVHEVNLVKTR